MNSSSRLVVSDAARRRHGARRRRATAAALLAASTILPPAAGRADGDASGYRTPPAEMTAHVTGVREPTVWIDPQRRFLLVAEPSSMPTIEEIARPVREVGGVRVDARTGARVGLPTFVRFSVQEIASARTTDVRLSPARAGAAFGPPLWSPDGSRFAFSRVARDGVELWIGDAETAVAAPRTPPVLNEAFGRACTWMPGGTRLLCRLVPQQPAPTTPPQSIRPLAWGPAGNPSAGVRPVAVVPGPVDSGEAPPQAPHLASQLAWVDAGTGAIRAIGAPAPFVRAIPSPDGTYLLTWRRTGVSPSVAPASETDEVVEIRDLDGRVVRELGSAPAGPRGAGRPRGVAWSPAAGATIVWAERILGGDELGAVAPRGGDGLGAVAPRGGDGLGAVAPRGGEGIADAPRDRLVALAPPFDGAPRPWIELDHAFAGMRWIATGRVLVDEYDASLRRRRTWLADPAAGGAGERLVWDVSVDDAYADPGAPLGAATGADAPLVASHDGGIWTAGTRAASRGTGPFLDRLDLRTLERRRLWPPVAAPADAEIVGVVSESDGTFLLREGTGDGVGWAVLDLDDGSRRPLAHFGTGDRGLPVRTHHLRYRRPDGADLSAILYVAADHRPGLRLPLVLWAYPHRVSDPSVAGQLRSSVHRGPVSPVLLTTQGYAVMDLAMPIVGDARTGNDDFVRQVVENARAAVDAAVQSGIADRNRVAVAGHSYGAFMAVTLLAHSDLFRGGIALSGAYNRTLTPFGFQTEERTLWEAPDTYLEMSPFLYADRIDAPLLLVHGSRDAHPGTSPLQSELLFRAVERTGGTARLVLLPFEGHVYRARESVLHTLAETVEWLDRHVKPEFEGGTRSARAPARPPPGG